MTKSDEGSVKSEHQFHRYVGNRIPWYVRLIWVGFWCFVVYYAVTYLFPALQLEVLDRP